MGVCEPAALLSGRKTQLLLKKTEISRGDSGHRPGKLYVVGIGPRARNEISQRALDALKKSETIVGYKLYIDLVKDTIGNKQVISTAMRKEIERVELAIQEALAGKTCLSSAVETRVFTAWPDLCWKWFLRKIYVYL